MADTVHHARRPLRNEAGKTFRFAGIRRKTQQAQEFSNVPIMYYIYKYIMYI